MYSTLIKVLVSALGVAFIQAFILYKSFTMLYSKYL